MKLIIASGLLLSFGCTANLPSYKMSVLKKQGAEQPRVQWQYPSSVAGIDPKAGVSGLVKPRPIPSFLPDVEPPLVTAMHVLPDGAVAFISPLAIEYESARFVFGNYTRETPTRARLTVLDGDSGRQRWSADFSARGVFEIMDAGGNVLVQTRYFDTAGKLVQTRLFALRASDGEVVWARKSTEPFRYLKFAGDTIVFSPAESGLVLAIAADTGETRWQFQVRPAEDERLAPPVPIGDEMLFFERGVELRRLSDGGVVWHRSDVQLKGDAQPEVGRDVLWLPTTRGLAALDLATGRARWAQSAVRGDITRIIPVGARLYVAHTQEGLFSDDYIFSSVDVANGRLAWSYETEPLLGNAVEVDGAVFLTTAEELVALDASTGKELFDQDLPWDDEFSHHVLSKIGHMVVVRNEWNAAAWQPSGKRVYHHAFEPLCPIVTTKERMLEIRELGGSVTGGVNVAGMTYSSASMAAFHEARYQSAMSAFRSTGNSSYLDTARFHLRSAQFSGRMAASMQLNVALIGAIATVGNAALNAKIGTAHGLVYPAIDSVLQHIRDYDTPTHSMRLVGVTVSGQRLSALEILHLASGRTKRVMLSPYQLPYDLTTVGSHDMTATEISGYLPAAVFLGHAFSTVVDLEHGRVLHYGPGLDVSSYVRYAKTRFVRGKLMALPLELP